MASVYQNAIVTLSAAHGSSSQAGCYSSAASRYRAKEVTLLTGHDDQSQFRIYVRQHIPHPGFDQEDNSRRSLRASIEAFPLLGRAWVYQERLVSRRLIYFGAEGLSWECIEGTKCQCHSSGPEMDIPFNRPSWTSKSRHATSYQFSDSISTREPDSDPTVQQRWRKMVEEYSLLSLTMRKDIFPAISGLAHEMAVARPGDEYLAGLWKNTLCRDLAWIAKDPDRTSENPRVGWSTNVLGQRHPKRPRIWHAPSWSWASVDAAISFLWEGNRQDPVFDLVDSSIIAVGSDTMGELSSAHLILLAPVADLEREIFNNRAWRYDALKESPWDPEVYLDVKEDWIAGQAYLCVKISRMGPYNMGLIVRNTVDPSEGYQRVGFVSWFRDDKRLKEKLFVIQEIKLV